MNIADTKQFREDMLAGQCAIVTGAARGIGRAIAVALAQSGADIVVVDRVEEAQAAETLAMVRETGRKALFSYGDVTDYAGVEALVKAVVAEYGKIDILVNNAGITKDMLLPQMSDADFAAVVNVNLMGTFHMMRHVSRQMLRKKSGRIVNIASVAGIMGNAGQVNYAASKAGVIGMTKSAAKELASRGITVNAVAPGLVDTAMTKDLVDNNDLAGSVPLGRMARPEEIAALVTYLVSPMAGYITGEVIRIDGGLAM